MNSDLIDRIANTMLQEKPLSGVSQLWANDELWRTSRGLYPEACCRSGNRGDTSSNQAECLIEGTSQPTIHLALRFLRLTERAVGKFDPPLNLWPDHSGQALRLVQALQVDSQIHYAGQEARPCSIQCFNLKILDLQERPWCWVFRLPSNHRLEPVIARDGKVRGALTYQQQAIQGMIAAKATEIEAGLFRLTLRVINQTQLPEPEQTNHNAAALRSLHSPHTILGLTDGNFISLLDPPQHWRGAASECRNVGTWPVLIGEVGERQMLLSSPIVLSDYPHLVPECPDDQFTDDDIDEFLMLRILTMNEQQKRSAAAVDGRTRAMLKRIESLDNEQLAGLEFVVRNMQQSSDE